MKDASIMNKVTKEMFEKARNERKEKQRDENNGKEKDIPPHDGSVNSS